MFHWPSALALLAGLSILTGIEAAEKVLLKDVTAITLQRGQSTTGRRSAPVPQLRCVGGQAQGLYSPKVVQCYNRGFDGSDVQWECTSTMDDRYKLGKITVTCEGFDRPNDPYILKGSCGLEYELDFADGSSAPTGSKSHSVGKKDDESSFSPLLIIFGVVFAFILYSYFTNQGGDRAGGGGPDGRGPPPYPGWRPGPGGGPGGGGPGGHPPPPPYEDIDRKTTFTQSTSGPSGSSSSGPGFWSGAAAGAAAGYMASRAQNAWSGTSDSTRHRGRGAGQSAGWFEPHDDWEDRQRESTSRRSDDRSHGEHESTSFGGTSRR